MTGISSHPQSKPKIAHNEGMLEPSYNERSNDDASGKADPNEQLPLEDESNKQGEPEEGIEPQN